MMREGSRRKLISIHALRKESDYRDGLTTLQLIISIHALRKESDHASYDT